MATHKRIRVLGVGIDPLTIEETIERIIVRSRQQGSCYIIRPYVEFMVKASENSDIRSLFEAAWLRLPDGISLNWAAHFTHLSRHNPWTLFTSLARIALKPASVKDVVPDNFAGIKFTRPLLESAAEHKRSVFLIGSPEGSNIAHTANFLQQQIPSLDIAGTFPGFYHNRPYVSPDGDIDKAALQELETVLTRTQPDIILIGIGFPRQEWLASKLSQHLPRGVIIGEGGTFDYEPFGGNKKKAPGPIRTLNLEWLWRLTLEPRRLRRQLAIPRFISRVYRDLHSS